jgi:hypothetical protein
VKLGLYDGLRDIQIGSDLARRPSQIMGLSNQLTMRRVQLIPGFAQQFRIEQLVVHLVGSGPVDAREPISVSVCGHESERLSQRCLR